MSYVNIDKEVIKLFGGVKAIIYEEVSSLAQQEGYCFASYQYMADDLGMSRETVRRNIQELIKAGAIIDLKSNPRNTPLHLSINKAYLKKALTILKKSTPDTLKKDKLYLNSGKLSIKSSLISKEKKRKTKKKTKSINKKSLKHLYNSLIGDNK